MISLDQHIERCKNNNSKSQKKLYEHLAKQMFNVCLRYCKNRSDAEDVLQMGFVKVFQNIDQIEDNSKLSGWVRMIMVRTALKFIKQKPDFVLLEDNHFDKGDYVMHLDFDHYTYDKLLRHVQKLPVGYQTVFNLYVFEELTHKEIAQIIGCSEVTSRSQLYKARKQLQLSVQEDEQLLTLISNKI